MPVRYERDDARRRIVTTVDGPFWTAEILAVINRQRGEGAWGYGMLYDLRGMTGKPTLADLLEVMDEAISPRPGQGPRGPVALLASDPALYDIACKYAALGHSTFMIRVFSDFESAEAWLAAETRT